MFLGMVGYYRRFIHMLTKARLLTQLLWENALTPMEDETSKHAFKKLKSTFQATVILQIPNWNKPFLIYCDAFGDVHYLN